MWAIMLKKWTFVWKSDTAACIWSQMQVPKKKSVSQTFFLTFYIIDFIESAMILIPSSIFSSAV